MSTSGFQPIAAKAASCAMRKAPPLVSRTLPGSSPTKFAARAAAGQLRHQLAPVCSVVTGAGPEVFTATSVASLSKAMRLARARSPT